MPNLSLWYLLGMFNIGMKRYLDWYIDDMRSATTLYLLAVSKDMSSSIIGALSLSKVFFRINLVLSEYKLLRLMGCDKVIRRLLDITQFSNLITQDVLPFVVSESLKCQIDAFSTTMVYNIHKILDGASLWIFVNLCILCLIAIQQNGLKETYVHRAIYPNEYLRRFHLTTSLYLLNIDSHLEPNNGFKGRNAN